MHYRDYPVPRLTARKRVLSNISKEDMGFDTPCWLWLGETDRNGYGRIKRRGKYVPVHWILKGDPPDGLEVDHLCKIRSCVRPEHLEFVTRQENMRRRHASNSDKAE